jgi:hypothetical protein
LNQTRSKLNSDYSDRLLVTLGLAFKNSPVLQFCIRGSREVLDLHRVRHERIASILTKQAEREQLFIHMKFLRLFAFR